MRFDNSLGGLFFYCADRIKELWLEVFGSLRCGLRWPGACDSEGI